MDWKQQRVEKRLRQRRIILNNDGGENFSGPRTPRNFLKNRTLGLEDSQVDALFYCSGFFNLYHHQSRESEVFDIDSKSKYQYGRFSRDLKKKNEDSLGLIVKWCRENSREVFWSMRMNDIHDRHISEWMSQWKRQHPDCLMGKEGENFAFGNGAWSALDYNKPLVRSKSLRIVRDVLSRYDLDGIELDFTRHQILFKEQMLGKPIGQKHRDIMTSHLRRVRKICEEIGKERGTPLLISVTLPDSVGYCKSMGIDLKAWLKQDLVDIIVGGGYFKLEPYQHLIELGKKHQVPVYAYMERRRIEIDPKEGDRKKLWRWRGEALNAWKAGISGIYTFNKVDPHDKIFRELGDPTVLEGKKRIDQTFYTHAIEKRKELLAFLDPGSWIKDGRRHEKIRA